MTKKSPKVVLITGSSSGFGNLIAKHLSKNGFHVIATMRNTKGKNLKIAQKLKQLNKKIFIDEIDVSCSNSIKKTINRTINRFKKIDVIVNNAGIMNFGLAEGFKISQLEKQINTNYLGVARIFKEVIPHMKKNNGGLFITVSSIAGRLVFPYLGTYNPSKFAVEALAEAYRYELAPFRIDSVIIEPGPFPTYLIKNAESPQEKKCLEDYKKVTKSAKQILKYFKELMQDNPKCNSNLVSDAILKLIKTPFGRRPVRTTCGIDFGVKEINTFIEKYQKNILKQITLGNVIKDKN
tara:strand:+ start:95 stop:976 length:882 start_codon:yes stop_codon:yes gene_type:complete